MAVKAFSVVLILLLGEMQLFGFKYKKWSGEAGVIWSLQRDDEKLGGGILSLSIGVGHDGIMIWNYLSAMKHIQERITNGGTNMTTKAGVNAQTKMSGQHHGGKNYKRARIIGLYQMCLTKSWKLPVSKFFSELVLKWRHFAPRLIFLEGACQICKFYKDEIRLSVICRLLVLILTVKCT